MLTFARPTPADLAGYERLFLDPRVQHWLRPPPLPPSDRDEAAARLRRDIAHWDEHGFGPWALRVAATGHLVGRGGLQVWQLDGEPRVEVAWVIAPDQWGRGLATETARAAIAHARELDIPEVVAFTLVTNAASERVMQKAGMERVGPIEHAGMTHVLYRATP